MTEIELEKDSKAIEHNPHSYECETQPKKRGGWRAIKYILGNESFEKLASMSLVANITVYLRTKYNLSGLVLVNVVQIWSGTCNMASIAGAIISDAYLGRYLTLLFGSIFSLSGMLAMTLTASLTELRPPICKEELSCIQPHPWQLGVLFMALGLMALGAGGVRPCNIAFGADQFDTKTKKGRAQLECFFDWWYFSFTIVLIVALTLVVYVQTNISWVIGFAIPTVCFVMSITIFLIGRHTYVYKAPQGTVFVDLAKVVIASFRKRKLDLTSGTEFPFYNPNLNNVEGGLGLTMLDRVDRFKFFDKAAIIIDSSELDEQGNPKNGWRLCSVQLVENLKCVAAVFPVWISGIVCFVVMDQHSTFGILQAMQSNRGVGHHFNIPPAWLSISSMIALSLWILIYEQIFIPVTKRIMGREFRLTTQHKISIGIVISIISMIIAGLVETKRKALALKQGSFISPLHVYVLLPQFALSGLSEAFSAISLMEFFTLRLPENMRSVSGALFFLSLSLGSYLSSMVVNIIHAVTKGKGRTPWIGDKDLNKSRLEYYYYIIGGIGVINFLYFNFFAKRYVPSGKATKKEDGVELEKLEHQWTNDVRSTQL